MINNNLNSLLPPHPPPSSSPPLSPTSAQVSSPFFERKKGAKPRLKADSIKFPEHQSTLNNKNKTFIFKQTLINDPMQEELDEILNIQAGEIEKKFNILEKHDENSELVDAILAIETWSYDTFSVTNERMQQGVDFLDKVLPNQILQKFSLIGNRNEGEYQNGLKSLQYLTATFLSCLDIGAQGAALLYKNKLLEESKQLLNECKVYFSSQIQSLIAQESEGAVEHRDSNAEYTEQNHSTTKKKETIQKAIDEWEVRIALEEEELKNENTQYFLKTSSSILTYLSEPLTFIPHEVILKSLRGTKFISCLASGIEFAGLALELKKIREECHTLNEWKESYQKWQEEHQPQFKMNKNGAQRIKFFPIKQHFSSSPEKYEKALFHAIETNHLEFVKKKLKGCGIKIPSKIKTKEALIAFLKIHSNAIKKYTTFQSKLENLNVTIYTSENLLKKRQGIIEKKILLLMPQFEALKGQIRETKKGTFIKDFNESLTKRLQNPDCSLMEIEEIFNKWGFLKHSIATDNQALVLAFNKFKRDKSGEIKQKGVMCDSQKELLNTLKEWTHQKHHLDQHLDHWFHFQDKTSLMRDYIDHQETIEHTVKNSIKQMVQHKHDLETHFMDFKSSSTHIQFTFATFSLAASITFAVLGLLTIPFGGIGVILLALSIGSAVLSIGLFTAGYIHSRYYKPQTTAAMTILFQIKMAWTSFRNSISIYSKHSKEKKLIEVAKILYKLHHLSTTNEESSKKEEYRKALINYQKAKLDFENSQEKVGYWAKKLKKFESRIAEAGWSDFSKYASLPIGNEKDSFNTLDALKEALQTCDLRLLTGETRQLLEVQLGINIEELQAQIQKNPEAIKNSLQEFFSLSDAKLIHFIRNQQGYLKSNQVKNDSQQHQRNS